MPDDPTAYGHPPPGRCNHCSSKSSLLAGTCRFVNTILRATLWYIMRPIGFLTSCACYNLLPIILAITFFAFLCFPLIESKPVRILWEISKPFASITAESYVVSSLWCGYVGVGCRKPNASGHNIIEVSPSSLEPEVRRATDVLPGLLTLSNTVKSLKTNFVRSFVPTPTDIRRS